MSDASVIDPCEEKANQVPLNRSPIKPPLSHCLQMFRSQKVLLESCAWAAPENLHTLRSLVDLCSTFRITEVGLISTTESGQQT